MQDEFDACFEPLNGAFHCSPKVEMQPFLLKGCIRCISPYFLCYIPDGKWKKIPSEISAWECFIIALLINIQDPLNTLLIDIDFNIICREYLLEPKN